MTKYVKIRINMQKVIMKEYVGNVKEYEEIRGKYGGICGHMWKM